jgi:hypothetical protein
MRTQPVTCNGQTGVPVVRCPECGLFHAANAASTALRPWLSRLTSVVLAGWILCVIAAFVLLGVAEIATSYATLDELTAPEGYRSQRSGSATIVWSSGYGPLQLKADYPQYKLFVASILALSSATAYAGGLLAVVLFPHWRRAAYAALILGMPLAAGGLVAVSWNVEAAHLFEWALPYIAAHACFQVLGGLAGITFGRPMARLVIRIILPPSMRPRLAYLWLVDGKPLPRPS